MNRKDFFKTAGVAAAGIAVGGCSSPPQTGPPVGGSTTAPTAFIGPKVPGLQPDAILAIDGRGRFRAIVRPDQDAKSAWRITMLPEGHPLEDLATKIE